MDIIDSHAHIYLEQFSQDIDEVIERAAALGVKAIYMPNIDLSTVEPMLELANKHPGFCIPMMGLHPCSVKKDFEKQLYRMEEWLLQDDFFAIGEIGTDLYWDTTFWEHQQEALAIQIEWAKTTGKPFVIHCRKSIPETIGLMESLNNEDLYGVFHCFSGTVEEAEKITGMGFKLGIGGVATFKNGGLDEVIERIDISNILLETDSPYLAPAPNRGKRNEPSFLPYIVQKVAEVKSLSGDEVAFQTTENSNSLFNPND